MTGQFLSRPFLPWSSLRKAWARDASGLVGQTGRVLAIATTLLALSGCTLGLIYPRLDSLISWQLDRYLRLETGQERWLDERLEERLGWHQREQLPKWREALAGLRADIATDQLDTAKLSHYGELTESLLKASLTGLVDDTTQLATSLTEPQVQHLLEHFDEETEEFTEELAERQEDPAERERERFDNLLEDVEQWLGSVSPEQKTFLQEWQSQSIRWSDYTLESRQRWREFIVQTLNQRSDPAATRAAVETMLLAPATLRTESYQAAAARQVEHRRALHLYLLQSMTPKQKKHLLAELDDYLEEMDELLADNA